MKVSDLMSGHLARLPRDANVVEAIELMAAREVSSVLVEKGEKGEPWGIVTHSEIVSRVAARGLDPSRVSLAEVMSPALVTVDPGLDVGYATRLMLRFDIRHLPVVQGDDLVGILCYPDVLRVFNLLQNVPFFERLSADDLIALLNVSSVRRCRPGQVLIQEGDQSRDLFLLEAGEMVVSTRRAGRIARIRAGELFGEMELFGGRRSATVRAVRDARILVIDGERFVDLALSREHLGAVVFESMSRLLSDRLRRANRFLFLRGIWSHRALVLRVALICAAVFVALVLGIATVSESPSFCKTCHNMRPYYASWNASLHRDTKCTNCHWSYGMRGALRGKITGLAMVVRYVTETYGPKPEAKVDDDSCLRPGCHDLKTLARRFRTVEGDVRFDHSLHQNPLSRIGELRCTSCHNHQGQEEHFSVSASICFLCHFSGSGTPPTPCRGCHQFKPAEENAPIRLRVDHAAFGPLTDCLACHGNIAEGSGVVEHEQCISCHLRPDSLAMGRMHRVHVRDEDVDCFDCHSTIGHPGPSGRILSGRCETCHPDAHLEQERLYLGEGGVGIAQRPALMFYYHVECTACHEPTTAEPDSVQIPAHEGKTTSVCIDCHDITFEDRVRMWNTEITRSLERIDRLLSRFQERVGPDGAIRYPEAFRLYEEARRNYEIVASDPSAGIHNYRYATDLLKACEAGLTEAMDRLRKREGDER